MLRDLVFDLTPNLLGHLYFRTGLNLVRTRREPIPVDDLRRICVLATSGIGNLVLLTPMLYQLRTKLPQAQLDLVVAHETAKSLLEGTDLVDQIWVFSRERRLWRAIRGEWYDLTIAATHRGFMRAKQAFRTGARYRIGFRYDHAGQADTDFFLTHPVDYRPDRHEVELGMHLLSPLGIQGESRLRLPLLPEECARAEALLPNDGTRWVALHPLASKEPRKAWPLERYLALGARIQRKGLARIVLVGGPEEREALASLAGALDARLLAGKLSLRETAAVLARCTLFVGNDGGPMHLAAAVGTPVVAFFGPTNPQIYGPWGEGHTVLQSTLPCSPCHQPHSGQFGCDTNACLQDISLEQAWQAVVEQLGRKES